MRCVVFMSERQSCFVMVVVAMGELDGGIISCLLGLESKEK